MNLIAHELYHFIHKRSFYRKWMWIMIIVCLCTGFTSAQLNTTQRTVQKQDTTVESTRQPNLYVLQKNGLSTLYRLDPQKGSVKGLIDFNNVENEEISNGIIYTEHTLQGQGYATTLMATRLSDNKYLWTYQTTAEEGIQQILAITPNTIYMQLIGQQTQNKNAKQYAIVALNIQTGQLVWHYDWLGQASVDEDVVSQFSHGSIIVEYSAISGDYRNKTITLTNLQADTGEVAWNKTFHGAYNGRSELAIDANHIFFLLDSDANTEKIVEVDEQSAATLWQGQLPAKQLVDNFQVIDHMLLVEMDSLTLFAIQTSNYANSWSYTPQPQQKNHFQWFYVDHVIYSAWTDIDPKTFAEHTALAAWHISDGKELWQTDTNFTGKLELTSQHNWLIITEHQNATIDGTAIEVRQAATGSLYWYKQISKQTFKTTHDYSESWKLRALEPASQNVSFSSGLSYILPDNDHNSSYIYIETIYTKGNFINYSASTQVMLYALALQNGNIIWQHDPTTFGNDLPPIKVTSVGLGSNFARFVGQRYAHYGRLTISANGSAEMNVRCYSENCSLEDNDIIKIQFTRVNGTTATGIVTYSNQFAAIDAAHISTPVTAILSNHDVIKLQLGSSPSYNDFCNLQVTIGYCS